VQVPAETRVTVVPDTVQTGVVAEVRATVSPLEAEGEIEKVLLPCMVRFAREPNVMVWLAL
jgi:hypothetical protein